MPTEAELPPDLRALPAIQAFPVRAGPNFLADMMRLYQQINTKLAWRPASVTVATLAVASALIFVATRVFGSLIGETDTAGLIVLTLLVVTMAGALLIGSITALTLAIRRRSWSWVWCVAGALTVTLAVFVTFPTVWQPAVEFYMAALFAFALIGPRRETAFA